MPRPLRLAYVLNHGDSLRRWDEAGLLRAQSALARGFQARGTQVSIVSFGGRDEFAYQSQLPGMRILCNWLGLPPKAYARRLHQLHAPRLLQCDVVETADSSAIVTALRIAWAWQIPLVYRFTFILSKLRRSTAPDDTELIADFENMERRGMAAARLVIGPTRQTLADMAALCPPARAETTILPSAVDTDKFRPMPESKRYDLIYVGRLTRVKNLAALLEAVQRLDVSIAVIGGELPHRQGGAFDDEAALKARFGDLDGRIDWLGRMKQAELPRYFNRARAFVLCSHSEGSPRSLIEAMACGLPVICSDVPEMKYVVQHKVNGYLCDTDSDSIACAIKTVLASPDMMQTMGANARQYALEQFSLPMLAQREFELLRGVAQRYPVASAPKRLAQYLFRRNAQNAKGQVHV